MKQTPPDCQCYYCRNNLLDPEEEKALDDIMTGKTKMIRQSGEEFLKELKAIRNRNPNLFEALAKDDPSLIK
jgi:hypothetical protein